MARTTVDDCLEQCPNHFELAYRAARRARDIMNRGDPRVPDHGDKSIVISLREIADPNAVADQAPPPEQVEPMPQTAAYFGDIPPSPDEPDPTDPMGEKERARRAAPAADSDQTEFHSGPSEFGPDEAEFGPGPAESDFGETGPDSESPPPPRPAQPGGGGG